MELDVTFKSKCLSTQFNISRSALKDMRHQGNNCDVYLVCKDGKLPAHRLILSAGSKYFDTMFSNDFEETSSNEVEFLTLRKESMEIILDCIYLQNVNLKKLSEAQIWDLLSTALLLEVSPLVEECVDELVRKLTNGNWVAVLTIAQRYSIERLISAVVKHLDPIDPSAHPELLKLDFDCLNVFINNSLTRGCHSENTLVNIILTWVGHNKSDRKKYIQRLISPIDFASVSKTLITKLSNDSDLLNNNIELSHCLLKKLSHAFTPRGVANTTNPKVLIFKSNTVHSFDVSTKMWSVHNLLGNLMPGPNSPIAISDHAVYYTADAKCNQQCNMSRGNQRNTEISIIVYYPQLNCGNEIATHLKVTNFGMAFVNDALYFIGGAENSYNRNCYFESFDLNSKEWRQFTSPNVRRLDPTVVASGENLYVFGGKRQENLSLIPVLSAEKYCSFINQWTVITTLCGNLGGNITAVPCSAKIYLAKSITNGRASSKLFEFDPKDNSWKKFNVKDCGILCRGGSSVEFLVFQKSDKYYRMNPREKKLVLIKEKNSASDVVKMIDNRRNTEMDVKIIFA